MRRILIVSLVLVTAAIFSAITFAGIRPVYNCAKAGRACERGCDQRADTGKNANAYNRCLEGCKKAAKRCEKRQSDTNICADAFQRCLKSAGNSDSARKDCRKNYRTCKGNR